METLSAQTSAKHTSTLPDHIVVCPSSGYVSDYMGVVVNSFQHVPIRRVWFRENVVGVDVLCPERCVMVCLLFCMLGVAQVRDAVQSYQKKRKAAPDPVSRGT